MPNFSAITQLGTDPSSLLAQAEVSLPQIMERLGHKDEDTTKNIYLHVTKEMKKEASQKFKELMENL
ncbi:hypothetical protein P4284_05405 [Bacillus swezeyi]|uniref:hypothetical protein n=1 Tax=Bacillus swezeyi TaxID=1925020 RepID=UPI002E1B9B76|nr:hypothetical protein [Bacillus swezeyi]MED2976156.1 hypothetical protein [Bacillus swezeyi]